MYSLDQCPCCKGDQFQVRVGILAPFIARYVLDQDTRLAEFFECNHCSFRFFKDRFTAEQMKKLYGGYRGMQYLKERNRYEFWYTRAINDSIGRSEREIELRKHRIEAFLSRQMSFPLDSVLDFGGDSGQFIPESSSKNKFVFDLSGARPVEGVEVIGSKSELEGRTFDLILLCHVLEHYSDPAEGLREISAYLRPGESKLLIEVPLERYSLRVLPRKGSCVYSVYKRYLGFLIGSPKLLTALDFLSSFLRVKLHLMSPFGFLKLHEHINFFNQKSLQVLLDRVGFDVIAFKTVQKGGHSPVILCLAQLRPS